MDKVICPWWNDRFDGPDVQKTVNSSQLQFLDDVVVPVVVQRQVLVQLSTPTAGDRQGVRGQRRGSFSGVRREVVSTGTRPP